MLRPHSFGLALSLVLSLLLGVAPAAAQSVESIVTDMRAQYERQLETVDSYILETNLYTAYHRKVMQNGSPTYQTQTRMKGEGTTSFASNTTPSAAYGLQFDRLIQHATYGGTETINGTRCHILRVDDPSKVDPNVGEQATQMTYYVDAERSLPARMVMQTAPSQQQGPEPSSVTINFLNYTTTDGLTLPHRMEIQLATNISDAQRQQMQQMMKQMEQLPAQQRKQMEKMMGDQMDMMKQMMSGEPIVIEVQSVRVNTEIPDGIF